MTTTTNLGLKKPDQSDGVNVGDLNSNMDALDQEIKGLKDNFSPEGSAKDADKLGGKAAGEYSLSGHKHDGVYAPTAHNHSGVYAPVTHSHTPAEAGATPAAHGSDTTIHVTAADKTNWNGKAAGSHNHDGVYSAASHSHNLLTYSVTHSKSGTVHTLTGLPTAAGIFIAQFKAVANFDAGNTFAGGYTAKPVGEETALPDKAFITGDLVSVVVDVSGKKLGFKLGGASAPKFPTYTGAHAVFGTEKQGYMELYSSGTLTPKSNMNVEAFLVGGGSSGAQGGGYGSGGGAGGYVKLLTGVALNANTGYSAVIGSGGAGLPWYNSASGSRPANAGGSTSFVGNSVLGGYAPNSGSGRGGDGGSGGGSGVSRSGSSYYKAGDGGTNGSNGGGTVGSNNTGGGGTGSGVSTSFNGKTYAGGGGGGAGGSNSTYYAAGGNGKDGGGNGGNASAPNGRDAIANTGSGGGGAYAPGSDEEYYVYYYNVSGAGGSGIIIIRWGY